MQYRKQQNITGIINKSYNPDLEVLFLGWQGQNWVNVLQGKNWSTIKQLYLSQCNINDNNLKELVNLDWPELIQLQLKGNNITARGIKYLTTDYIWPKLKQLYLIQNNIGDEGFYFCIKYLQNQLNGLYLNSCNITPRGIKSLLTCQTCLITKLYLDYNPIGNRGIKYLVHSNLLYLGDLSLRDCKIENEGYKLLTKAYWPYLESLWSGNQATIDNKMLLNGWQYIYETSFVKCIGYQFPQSSGICYMKFIVVGGQNINYKQFRMKMKNKTTESVIKKIFYEKEHS